MSYERRRVRGAGFAKPVEQLESRTLFAGVGEGLVGEYFADKTFGSLALARTDSTVNFNWAASPGASLPADGYSVRWSGQVLAEHTQTHTFFAAAAGGVRVWVNGVKVIDNWTTHGLQENQGSIALTAGQYYPIAVEYREEGTGSMKLSWSGPSTSKQVIPQSQLYRVGSSVISGGWLEGHVGTGSGSVDGSLNGGIDISHGAATSPPTVPPTAGLNFNFQPDDAPTVSGYTVDAGQLYGVRNGQTYGWSTNHTDAVIDRNINSNQLLDTRVTVKAGARWELAVPNGSYTVKLSVGDAGVSSNNNVYIEGVSLFAYVPLNANNFLTRSVTVSVADGKLTLGVGSAATGQTKLNFIEVNGGGISPPTTPPTIPPTVPPTVPPSGGINVNFQPAGASTVSDYLVDAGLAFAARNGQSYGWSTSHADTVVDRNINGDQLLDTNVGVKQGARWEMAVPNGTYTVTVGVGDAGASSSNNVWIEGNNLFNYQPLAANSFSSKSIVVNVSDGRVTLGIGSAGTGQTKLDFIQIAGGTTSPPTTPPTTPPTVPPTVPPTSGLAFNFQPASAPTMSGYLVDGGNTFGTRNGQSYGWTTNHADVVVDRDINGDQVVDTNLGVKQGARWEVAVPNGSYTVTVGIGDAGASSRNNVWIEGVNVFNYQTLAANTFNTKSTTVNVADGRLTLGIGSAATGQTRITHLVIDGLPSSPPASPPPAVSPPPAGVNINFQPADAATLDGYLIDAGLTYASRNGQTYGWTSSHADTVIERNINSDQRIDTNVAVQKGARWELAVPNGSYTVTIGVGDAGAASTNNVWIEGVNLFAYVPLGSNDFLARSTTVSVVDGNLTLGIGSAATDLVKLNYIQVSGSGLGESATFLSAAAATPSPDSDAAGAGTIGGSGDSFHYLYRVVRGNVELTARLDSLSAGEGGLIARGGLAGGGAFVGLTSDGASVSLEYRTAAGAAARTAGSVPVSGAVYLRLVRDVNQYAGYLSSTGVDGTWQLVGTAGVDLGTFNYVGIAAAGQPATARFSSTEIRPMNPLGGNVNSMTDRIQDLPFVDLVKTTRGFFNTAGRNDPATGRLAFATTDGNGWPTENFFFDVVDNTEWNVPVDLGVYKMSFSGPEGVTVASVPGVSLSNHTFSNGTHTYDVNVPANLLKLSFTFGNTGGQVKNIRVLQPGYSLSNTPTFTAKYLNLLKVTGPQVLRLMDWTKTNDNPVSNWSERNTPSSATQSQSRAFGELQPVKGIAWEYGIELANELGRNVWVNVPAQATDSYVRNLASMLRSQLRPDLNIWVEYTNEAWNTVFAQTNWIREQAVAEVFADKAANRPSQLDYTNLPVDTTKPGASNPNASTWGERWYARRTKQISDIFADVWTDAGEANPTNLRVRTVLGAQIAAMSRTTNHLTFLNRFYPQPQNYLHAVGVAPYANTHGRPQSTKEEVISSLSASINAFNFKNIANTVKSWGLELVAYEIGFDTFGPENIAAKRAASLDPRMQEMLVRFMQNFYRDGGTLGNWFTVGARSYNSPYGTWPLTEDLDILDSAKIKGYQQVRDAMPVNTTAHGVFA